ncbi:HNH endonuclease [Ruminococcus bovis]|uniref:HNH endonuclease n=2 Tax=Ruminococcus bovis TaxID=2564099 RepID=A0A4P8XXS9_9FIRM|nr:HNH endonuclease [Ruminococcus bovis]
MSEIVKDAVKLADDLWPEIQQQNVDQPISPADIGREAWKKADIEQKATYSDVPRYVITRNETLENDRHPITGVSFERQVVELPDGEKIEGVFPQFESIFDAKIPENLYLQPDRVQFRECNRQLAQEIENNLELRKLFSEEQLEQIMDGIYDGTAPDGYVWHHDSVAGKLQLVDFETHSRTGHTGGRSLWGGGSNNR